jgi:hypothetical protein
MTAILRSALAASSLMLILVSSAQAASLDALMKSAINASDGRASGVLNDPVAGLIAKTTVSAAQVTARIETVRVYRQAGCRRLKAVLSQPVSGQPEAIFMFEMNLCLDGTAPQDGIDLAQAAGRFGVFQSVR